jgi:hypothetical protein
MAAAEREHLADVESLDFGGGGVAAPTLWWSLREHAGEDAAGREYWVWDLRDGDNDVVGVLVVQAAEIGEVG